MSPLLFASTTRPKVVKITKIVYTVDVIRLLLFKSIPLTWLIFLQYKTDARGGGSKRTFGQTPKSQGSQSQNLADCADQSACGTDLSDPSWRSAFGATMALVGPLFVLLTLIAMIKFCFANAYPKGHYQRPKTISSGQDTEFKTPTLEQREASGQDCEAGSRA